MPMNLNSFDLPILEFYNSFAGRSWFFDRSTLLLSQSDILQGSVAVAIFWRAWFLPDPARNLRRTRLIGVLGGAFLALVTCRLAVMALPHRARPIHEAGIQFVMPIGMSREYLHGWSAFPSDHATYAFALAAGLWFISSKAGLLLLVQAAFLICLPRVYLGLHYPTDILAGAAIGAASGWIMTRPATATWLAGPLLALESKRPALFYSILALLTVQLADMMREVRAVAKFVGVALRSLVLP